MCTSSLFSPLPYLTDLNYTTTVSKPYLIHDKKDRTIKRRNSTDQKDTINQTATNAVSLIYSPCNQLVITKLGYKSTPGRTATEWVDVGGIIYICISIININVYTVIILADS